jgi:sugar phosphate isomerase/epimerase
MFVLCGWLAFSFVMLAATAGATAAEEKAVAKPAEAPWVLASRLTNYGEYQEIAWSHLPSIGVKHVFLPVPLPDELASVQKRLAEHGLTVVVMRGQADLATPTSVDGLAEQLKTCQAMGVKYLFLSPKHPGVSKEDACLRLRRAGQLAQKYGVTIVLETHPDLGTNGDVHRETMQRINHPNVRVNFDTGNITYYNENRNAPAELLKIIDYVATVELKDHSGKDQQWNFPALGQGVVDIPGVLRILKGHGFSGPITMEIEGIRGVRLNEEQVKKNMADSAAYLRSLGTFK